MHGTESSRHSEGLCLFVAGLLPPFLCLRDNLVQFMVPFFRCGVLTSDKGSTLQRIEVTLPGGGGDSDGGVLLARCILQNLLEQNE